MEQVVETVSGQKIYGATTEVDYDALAAAQLTVFWGIISMGDVLVNDTRTRDSLLAMFGSATVTRANLAALQTETVSQVVAKELGRVRVGDVQIARAV